LGVSKVPFWTHFWASLAGYALTLFLLSFFGQKLFEVLKSAPASVWLGVGVGAALVLLGVLIARRYRQRAS
jgi:uncharacterized membrane protein YdjX (TVP38/TMEM64 family)